VSKCREVLRFEERIYIDMNELGVDSDHRAIRLSIRSVRSMGGKRALAKKKGKTQFIDKSLLSNENVALKFKKVLAEEMKTLGAPPNNLDSLEFLEAAVNAAAKKVLSRDRTSTKGWYQDRIEIFDPLTTLRNTLQDTLSKTPLERAKTRECTAIREKLRKTKKKIEKAVKQAKRDWLEEIIGRMTQIISGGYAAQNNSKDAWQAVRDIVKGLESTTPVAAFNLLNKNGEKCKDDEETIEVVTDHFSSVQAGEFDLSVLSGVDDHLVRESLGVLPGYAEIRRAVYKMKSDKSPGESGISAEHYKVLMKDNDAASELLLKVIQNYWKGTETFSTRFNVALLKLVFKKGNRGLAANWRPISLLDVASKIVSSIIARRLQALIKEAGYRTQFGFTEEVGTCDGIFALKTALRKRMEMNITSYVLYVDLVKAFDTIERSGLMLILKKYGLPASLLDIIERMHKDTSVKFVYKGKNGSFDSTSGVKQGDPLAPVLFLFVMQFAMETLERDPEWQILRKAQFATRHDGTLSGRDLKNFFEKSASDARYAARDRSTNRETVDPEVKGDNGISAFELMVSLYADDGAFLFTYRKDLEVGTNILVKLFKRFGMQMHIGSDDKKSKTEFTCFSKGGQNPFGGQSKLPVSIFDDAGEKIGIVTHTPDFIYLGTAIADDLDDTIAVKLRIGQAQGMFSKLEKCLFKSKDFPLKLKSRLYSALILSVLLYGSESWCTTGKHIQLLNAFHHRCVRSMTGSSLFAFQRTSKLLKKLGLPTIESLVGSRFLNWLGHVARLPETSFQRKLLTSFVTHEQAKNVQANKFTRPATSTQDHLKRNRYFKRTYGQKAAEWLTRATEHPDFNEPGSFDKDPDSDLVLRNCFTKGIFCQTVSESNEVPSWYVLAQDRILWNEVCLLVDHECLGKTRIAKRQKKAAKNKARDSSLNAEAEIWCLK
jgi:hypothetical protein